MAQTVLTLPKNERLCSRRLIDRLFAEGDSVSSFPIRIVYRVCTPEDGVEGLSVLFSVSKKHFKRAVCRNRVKRQMRALYRLSKSGALSSVSHSLNVTVAFVFCDSKLWDTTSLSSRFNAVVEKLATRLSSFCDNRGSLVN